MQSFLYNNKVYKFLLAFCKRNVQKIGTPFSSSSRNIGTPYGKHVYGTLALKNEKLTRFWEVGTQARWHVNHAGMQARWHVNHVGTQARMERMTGNLVISIKTISENFGFLILRILELYPVKFAERLFTNIQKQQQTLKSSLRFKESTIVRG